MQRLAPVDAADLTESQKEVHDKIASGPRGAVRGPFSVLLHNPVVADPVQELGARLRFRGTLPGKLRELAILTVARQFTAHYEWHAHVTFAKEEGLDPAIIEAIADRRPPDFTSPDEETVHAFCREILDGRRPGDEVYARTAEAVGADGLVELVALAGYYSLISMTLNAFDIKPPEGAVPPALGD